MSLRGSALASKRELCLLSLLSLCIGCSDASTRPPTSLTATSTGTGTGTGMRTQLLAGKSVRAERAAPILGGTLLVTRDDATVVLADPDRDRVFFVDLHSLAVGELALEPGDEPGRVLEGPAGRVFVLTRRTGALVAIDIASRSVSFRVPVCRSPRGIDYDAKRDSVLVACRSGLVLTLAAGSGETLASAQFDDDLRDVLVRGDELVLTRGRSSEILVVSESGTVSRRGTPLGWRPSHLFRSLLLPSGEVLLAHQTANFPEFAGLNYATPNGGCNPSIVTPTLSLTSTKLLPGTVTPPPTTDPRDQVDVGAMGFNTLPMGGLLGPMDIALSPSAGKFALLALGNAWNPGGPGPTLIVGPLDAKTGSLSAGFASAVAGCANLATAVPGEPIAVALDARGRVYVQSREPAALVLDNGVSVLLSDLSRADTGLALFYMNAGGNVACASCHPEGHEDGLTWVSAQLLPRRTQSLAGGLSSRKPYHWGGELSTFPALIGEVLVRRMGALAAPTTAQIDTLSAWLDQIPAPQVTEHLDVDAVERGRALFEGEADCVRCHGGPDFSDHELHDLATFGPLRTPSLLGVSARAPYFHDGCAPALSGIFGACGGPDHGRELPAAAKLDLVEYLRSL